MERRRVADEKANFWDEIKRRVDLVEYLATHCGADFVSDGPGRVAACCPFHAEDTPSFKVSDSRSGEPWKTWRCYGQCSEGGTIIDAVMKKEGFAEAIEAADFLNELYELGFERDNRRYERFKQTKADAEAAIERAQTEMASESRVAKQAREYLRRRGLSDETIDHFGLAVDTHEAKSGRLAIPIHDRAGHAISVSHRALFDAYPCASCQEPVSAKDVAKRFHLNKKAKEKGTEPVDWEACPHCGVGKTEARISWLIQQHPKYKNQEGHDKSRVLYNEAAARKALREPDSLGYFIMEGYGDVWACHQGGQLACSSYNGSTISEWQAGEAAKLCLVQHPPKPIVLIPDFDSTGLAKVRTNIDTIRHANPLVEIQIISSLAFEDAHPKDLGELLQRKGAEAVARILAEQRVSAEEWLIRDVMDATIAKTGKPAHSKTRQMELVAEILEGVRHRISLDHIVPMIAERWNIGESQARTFLNANIAGRDRLPAEHLLKNVEQAQTEATAYLREDFVIPHGFEALDRCFPGGGARTAQLSLWLGKAQPLHSRILTPSGWSTMGAMRVGAEVTGIDGRGYRVSAIHEQGMRPNFRLSFSDGSSAECCRDHLWTMFRNGALVTRTLGQIVADEGAEYLLPQATMQDDADPSRSGGELEPSGRRLASVAAAGHWRMRCLELEEAAPHRLYITDDHVPTHNSGVGKTALMLQVLANMSRKGIRCIFFSLEQPAAQLYMRMTCQALDVRMDEAIELIKTEDERLAEVNALFANLVIVDNVPTDDAEMVDMTALRIMKIIQDVNLTRFSAPAQVVAVDHLGILKVSENAPRSVQNDDLQAAGYIMQEIFHVCKRTSCYFMVLQQLPKEVKSGEPIMSGDMGRGGAKQQDFADFVFGLWRPEQKADLTDEERMALAGQYKIYPAKNRHGPSELAHLYFDRKNLRIVPALSIMPVNPTGGVDEDAMGEAVVIGGTPGAPGEDGLADFEAVEHAALTDEEAPASVAPATLEPSVLVVRDDGETPPPESLTDPSVPMDAMSLLEFLGGTAGETSEGDLPPDYFDT